MKNIFIVLFLSMILSACGTVKPEEKRHQKQLAISTVKDSSISYAKESLFRLSPKYPQSTTLTAQQTEDAYQLYTKAIIENLQSHDYLLANDQQQAAFVVGFGVALSSDVSDDKLNEKFGVSPGLQAQESLQKGSFLIYIEDAITKQIIWRGIAQGFAHDKLTNLQRKQRTKAVVNEVLKQFYQSN